MDHFVLGKRHGRVDCEILEADMKGNPPNVDGFDESSQSLLDVIVEQNDKVCADSNIVPVSVPVCSNISSAFAAAE